jgi:hypothetical protein
MLGWESIIELEQGIQHTYEDFKQQYNKYVKAVHLNEPVQVAHV